MPFPERYRARKWGCEPDVQIDQAGSPPPVPPPTLVLSDSKYFHSKSTDTGGVYDFTPPPDIDVVEVIFGQNVGQAEPAQWNIQIQSSSGDVIFVHATNGSMGVSMPFKCSANLIRSGAKIVFSLTGTVGGSAMVNYYKYIYP